VTRVRHALGRRVWQTRPFSARVWDETAELRRRIDDLPLLTRLADGTLEPHRFAEYLAQDDLYLRGYARALAMLATRAPTAEAAAFWSTGASGAVAAEIGMHAALMADDRLAGQPRARVASPTTRAYVNLLQATTAYEHYAVGVAAVLPCYWVYADVGQRLAATASVVDDHPYRAWLAAYDDPAFQDATRTAITLMDDAAEAADDATRAAMAEVFRAATWYEMRFWAASYDLEAWPLP